MTLVGWVLVVAVARLVRSGPFAIFVAVPLAPRLIRKLSLVYPREKFRSRLISTFVEFALAKLRAMAEKQD